MNQKSKSSAKWVWRSLGAVGVALAVFAAIAALGPDQELTMTREIPSKISPQVLGQSLHFLSNWPRWNHFCKEAKRLGHLDQPLAIADQYIVAGSILELGIVPKDQEWKRFALKLEVTEYIPQRKVSVRLLSDSKNKIPQLVHGLNWTVEIVPDDSGGSLVRGTVSARTANWRARLFARVASRILLNQVLYADLFALSAISDPRALSTLAPHQQ